MFYAPEAARFNYSVIGGDATVGSVTFNTNATNAVNIKLTNPNNAQKTLTIGSATVPGSITMEDPGVAVTHTFGLANPGVGVNTPNELTITVNGASNRVVRFNDAVIGVGSIKKEGTGTLQMSSNLGVNNSYSGGTTINGGTVKVTTAAGRLGTGDVVVNSGGTLWLSVGGAIGDTNTLTVTTGGKVNLAAGINETVYNFRRGADVAYAGVYGATGSGAKFIDNDIFSGIGTLTVLAPDPPKGTVIAIR